MVYRTGSLLIVVGALVHGTNPFGASPDYRGFFPNPQFAGTSCTPLRSHSYFYREVRPAYGKPLSSTRLPFQATVLSASTNSGTAACRYLVPRPSASLYLSYFLLDFSYALAIAWFVVGVRIFFLLNLQASPALLGSIGLYQALRDQISQVGLSESHANVEPAVRLL